MKVSAAQVCSIVFILGLTIVTVSSMNRMFDIRPSCIYNGREFPPSSVIETGTCEYCYCMLGHPRCHSRNCPFRCRRHRCPSIARNTTTTTTTTSGH